MAPTNITIERVADPTGIVLTGTSSPGPLVTSKTQKVWRRKRSLFSQALWGQVCLPTTDAPGGDMSLLPDFGGVMVRSLILSPGVSHVYTARHQNGELVGFTIFALPSQLMCSTDEQRENGRMTEFMEKLSPEGRTYYAETMGKEVPKANDEAFGIEAAERNTYWCNLAMVRADHQGKGIAKAMFELAFTEAAKTEETVALTTTNIRNVPIYEKIGLKLYGEKRFPSQWTEWTLWFFARETKG